MDRTPLATVHVKLLAFDLLSLTPSPSHSDPTSFTRKGVSVARAEVLGVVTSRELKPDKFLKFTIDDGTGCVVCLLWLNHLTSSYFSRRNPHSTRVLADVARCFASEVRIGVVARVRGRITGYRGAVQVTVSDVAIERKDPNVEILHWLDCVRLARCCYDVVAAPPPKWEFINANEKRELSKPCAVKPPEDLRQCSKELCPEHSSYASAK